MIHRAIVALLLIVVSGGSSPVASQELTCGQFDSWIWAQTIFEQHPEAAPSLDPDGNGIACEDLPLGFAPATWTDQMPDGLLEAQIINIPDGDTLNVFVNGVEDTVRLYRADTPETYFNKQCGADLATSFTTSALALSDTGATVYLEGDGADGVREGKHPVVRDPNGRLLAYLWFTVEDLPYMLNESLIRSGMGNDVDYGDHLYDEQLIAAASFAEKYQLGVYAECGGFDLPDLEPEAPVPTLPPTQSCDSSYPTVCIPPAWEVGDLNCDDVPHRRFEVLPPDPHGFDGDNNGVGCESFT